MNFNNAPHHHHDNAPILCRIAVLPYCRIAVLPHIQVNTTMFTSGSLKGLIEQEDATSLLVESMLQGMDLSSVFQEEFRNEMSSTVESSNRRQLDNTDEVDTLKPKGYQPREYLKRMPKEQSSWYRRYLSAESRSAIQDGEDNANASTANKKLAAQFKITFRVYWRVFLEIKNLAIHRKFHDPNKKDAVGFAHDIELVLLGMFYYLVWDTTFRYIATNTEIDAEVHFRA